MIEFVMKELFLLFRDKLKEQAFSTFLLLGACGVLGWFISDTRKEHAANVLEVKTEVKQLQSDLSDCNINRVRTETALEALKEQFDAHKAQFIAAPKRKK